MLNCPSCEQPLESMSYEGQRLHQCSGCEGHLVEHQNLRTIERKREVQVVAAAAGTSTRSAGEEEILLCPRCTRVMNKFQYGKQPMVMVDQCPSCKALWLDAGELEAIQASFEQWEDGFVKKHPAHQRMDMTREKTASMFARTLSKPGLGTMMLQWILSLVILLGPGALIVAYAHIERWGRFVLIYLAVWAGILLVARFVTVEPDMSDLGWGGTMIDNPFSLSDDINRFMLAVKLLMALPKVVIKTYSNTFKFFS